MDISKKANMFLLGVSLACAAVMYVAEILK